MPTEYPTIPTASAVPISMNIPRGEAKTITESQIKILMEEQGFTEGLAKSFTANCTAFPLRIWAVDNSGSMKTKDGHRMVPGKVKDTIRYVDCSRWDEIKETVNYHIQLAGLLEAPTSFRLLNSLAPGLGPPQFDIAQTGKNMLDKNMKDAMNIMAMTEPGGATPLTSNVNAIHELVRKMKPQLVAEGKRVAIILATDGLPNDAGEGREKEKTKFVKSLRQLEDLPVWLVIRLCTDEQSVVDFYNDLDAQLELSMDVLDDFSAEAEEIYEHNKWFTYILPLHRVREMGFHDRVLDMIDGRPLTKGELRDVCVLLFGADKCDGIPDPAIDWDGFLNDIGQLVANEKWHWNPIKKKKTPLLDLKALNRTYGDKSACCTIQ